MTHFPSVRARLPRWRGFLAALALVWAPLAHAVTNHTVSSIAELRAVSAVSDAVVTMTPGTYWMTKNGTNPAFLDFTGTGTTYDFTGVTLLVDSVNLKGFGGADNTRIVRLLQISGTQITVRGLTLSTEITGTTEYWADRWTNSVEITGDGATLKDCTITTRGSRVYGYGDAFGKGSNPNTTTPATLPFRSHTKHSGIRVGRPLGATTGNGASGVTLDNVKVYMRTFGHGIYFQEAASNLVVKNCLVSGDTPVDSDTIIADPLYQQFGFATYGTKVASGIKISKQEDGIRTYGADTDGTYGAVTNITITDTVVERMRDAYALGDSLGTTTVTNCAAWDCETGFTPTQSPAVNTFTGCRGDARYGPLVFFRRSATSATMSVELAGTGAPVGSWPVALIAGTGHTVTLTRTAPAGLYAATATVNCSQAWREWRHRPATDIDALSTNNVSAATTGCSITNLTGQPLVLGTNASNNTATSDGGVINKGANNTYTGATLVAPLVVTDTWGTYTVFSGTETYADTLSLGGANATDAGTVVAPGGVLIVDTGLSVQGEPLTLSGDGTGNGALFSAGAIANTTRFNSTTGTITLAADASIGVGTAGNQFLIGPVGGTGALTKLGPGNLVMEGNANTFTGPLTVAAGTVTARANKAVRDLVIAAGATFASNASLAVNQPATATAALAGTLSVNGRNDATAQSATLGTLNGAGLVTATGTGVNALIVTGATPGVFTGVIEKNVSLTLNAPGSAFTLTGTHSYTGATTLTAGTLIVDGALPPASLVTVASGATLAGIGNVGTVDLLAGATVAPGNRVGTLTASSITLHGGATVALDVRDAGAASGGWDLLTATGPLAIAGDATPATPVVVALASVNADGAPAPAARFDASALHRWRIAAASAITGDFAALTVDASAFAAANPLGAGRFSLTAVGGDLFLDFTSPLGEWRAARFGLSANTGAAADTADPDADGRPNLLEYATGSDPLAAQAAAVVTPGTATDTAAKHLTLTFTRVADPSLTYSVQASADLATWDVVWSSTGTANLAGAVTVADTMPLGTPTRRFLRLVIAR